MSSLFQPGDVVMRYDNQQGKLMARTPHVVVTDSPERVALYVSPGTPGQRPARLRDDFVRRMLESSWDLHPATWHSNHVLRLTPPLACHSVDLYWRSDDWAFKGWYVNLQKPLRRREDGFETEDHVLDVWVEPDRRWEWKDEEDFEALTAAGYWHPDDARAIRVEGEKVIERIDAWASPFCDGWETWRPEPGWITALLGGTTAG